MDKEWYGDQALTTATLSTKSFPDRTKEARGIYRYEKYLGRRFSTMACALEIFRVSRGTTIVELGTSRAPAARATEDSTGRHDDPWNSEDPSSWDWSTGLFTRVASEHLAELMPNLYSVDTSLDALHRSCVLCAQFLHFIRFRQAASVNFLDSFRGKIDLLFIRGGEATEDSEWAHLQEAQILVHRSLMAPNGILLIDDTEAQEGYVSKGELSVPFLRKHGFKLLMADYQCLMSAP